MEKRQTAYAPAAAYVEEKQLPPQPFQYEYGVKDEYSGNAFAKTESQNDLGQVSLALEGGGGFGGGVGGGGGGGGGGCVVVGGCGDDVNGCGGAPGAAGTGQLQGEPARRPHPDSHLPRRPRGRLRGRGEQMSDMYPRGGCHLTPWWCRVSSDTYW